MVGAVGKRRQHDDTGDGQQNFAVASIGGQLWRCTGARDAGWRRRLRWRRGLRLDRSLIRDDPGGMITACGHPCPSLVLFFALKLPTGAVGRSAVMTMAQAIIDRTVRSIYAGTNEHRLGGPR